MYDAWEHHEAAVELIEKSSSLKDDEAHVLILQAFELEREAAMYLADAIDLSKKRSIVFCAAINLALRLQQYKDAHDLSIIAQKGLIHKDFVETIEDLRLKSYTLLTV